MALTATLALDIKAFEQGLSRATGALDGFAQRTVKNTNLDLSRMLEQFSGQKIVAESSRMVEAVERIGGASRLTESEQRKVNATVQEAIAKYRALGQEAPEKLRRLADETKHVDEISSSWSKKLSGSLNGAIMGVSASLTTMALNLGTAAVQGFGEFIRRGGEVSGMRQGFVSLAGGVEEADARTKAMRISTHGLINDFDIMAASNKGLLLGLGLNAQEMADLANTATVLGRAMGQDATKSLDDLITALGRSSPMILDNLGLSVKVAEANEAYAASLGKTAESLTEAEKKQAFMNAAMDAAKDKVRTLGDVQLTASDQITRMWTSIKNVTDAAADWTVNLGFVKGALDKVNNSLTVWDGLLRGGPKEALENYKRITGETIPEVNNLALTMGFQSEAAKALTMSEDQMSHISDKLTKSVNEKVKATEKAIDAAKKWNDSIKSMSRTFEMFKPRVDDAGESLQNIARGLEGNGTLITQTLQETAKMNAEMVKWANTNSAVFAPSIQSSMQTATASTGGFMDKLKGMFGVGGASGGGTSLTSILGAVGPQFAAAFMGPGSAGDKLKAFATQAGATLMGMIPVVGPWLSAFSGPIISGLMKLAAKAKSILSSIFGGPSSGELEGRAEVAAFEEQLWGTLTAAQELEAGGEAWKKTVIALTAAYVKAGKTEEEALAAAEKLWKSSKQGAEASRQAIEEINAVINALPDSKTIDIETNYTGGEPSGGVIGGPPGVSSAGSGGGASGGGGGGGEVIVRLELDGRQIAEAIVPHLPDALRRSGAASATWP